MKISNCMHCSSDQESLSHRPGLEGPGGVKSWEMGWGWEELTGGFPDLWRFRFMFDEEALSFFWLSWDFRVASPNWSRVFLSCTVSVLEMLGADSWQNIFSLKHLISEYFGSSSPQIEQLTGNLAAKALYWATKNCLPESFSYRWEIDGFSFDIRV